MDDDLLQKKEPQLPRRPSFKIKCVGRIALLYKSILLAWQCAVGLKITFKLKAHVTRRLKLGQIWNCIINRGLTMWWDHNWWCHINNHQQGIGVLRHWWKESCVQEDLDGKKALVHCRPVSWTILNKGVQLKQCRRWVQSTLDMPLNHTLSDPTFTSQYHVPRYHIVITLHAYLKKNSIPCMYYKYILNSIEKDFNMTTMYKHLLHSSTTWTFPIVNLGK